jgi:uncharacterized membrane protein
MSSTQRTVALFVVILAAFGLWLHSSDKLVSFLEALFGGGGGGGSHAPAPAASEGGTAADEAGGASTGGGGSMGGGAFHLPPLPSPGQLATILGSL